MEGLEAAPTLPAWLLWLLSDQRLNEHLTHESQDQALQRLGEGLLGIRESSDCQPWLHRRLRERA